MAIIALVCVRFWILSWPFPPGLDGATLEICRARACDAGAVHATLDASGDRLRLSAPLTAGVFNEHEVRAAAGVTMAGRALRENDGV